jgi:hypothetical protein
MTFGTPVPAACRAADARAPAARLAIVLPARAE